MKNDFLKRIKGFGNDTRKVHTALSEYISSLGLPYNEQYMAVLEYLVRNRTHPCVEEIYLSLHPKDPMLSRSRIFTILSMLAKAGAIQVINLDSDIRHFDGDTTPHAHFICSRCGHISDVEITAPIGLVADVPHGCKVAEAQILLAGICGACAADKVS